MYERMRRLQNILPLFQQYSNYIIIGLIAMVLIELILIIVAFKSLGKVERKYKRLMRGVNNKNLEEFIVSYLDKVDDAKECSLEAIKECKSLQEIMKKCIQKTSVVRFKAFEDVGSDLSFSVALLDQNNDGIVLTGIYGRNESTTYAKPIDKGISRYDLSGEELEALNIAINKIPEEVTEEKIKQFEDAQKLKIQNAKG